MNSNCLLCQLKGVGRHLNKINLSENERLQIIDDFMMFIHKNAHSLSNPEVAEYLNQKIKEYTAGEDLYANEKLQFNKLMLSKYDNLEKHLTESENAFLTAAKIAIAGNIIDFGPGHQIQVDETIERVLNTDLTIDDSARLMDDLLNAENIVYLGDNAGEIVCDKLFVKTIHHQSLKFVTRGEPVLNDITQEDANLIGMKAVCSVVDNGTAIPSTVMHRVSNECKQLIENADVIISKGQGNLEGLLKETDLNIYFLFTVKCEAIARLTNTSKGDFVLMHNSRLSNKINEF